jgi:hypothetical protein
MEGDTPKVKKWVCSPHALQRILERKITVEELNAVIQSPDTILSQGPKWIYARTIEGRNDNKIAAVLLERKENGLWVVLTVMVNFEKR